MVIVRPATIALHPTPTGVALAGRSPTSTTLTFHHCLDLISLVRLLLRVFPSLLFVQTSVALDSGQWRVSRQL